MEKEIWKDIPCYEGLYQVSNMGNIKSLSHKVKRGFCECYTKETIINPRNKDNGYLFVCLSSGSKKTAKNKYVHRLVAESFIPNTYGKTQVDHINGNKKDNRVVNLRWCSQIENVNNPNTKYKSKKIVPIECTYLCSGEKKTFKSMTEASKYLNIPLSSISCILRGADNMSSDKYGIILERKNL